jgi:hypothetical protein
MKNEQRDLYLKISVDLAAALTGTTVFLGLMSFASIIGFNHIILQKGRLQDDENKTERRRKNANGYAFTAYAITGSFVYMAGYISKLLHDAHSTHHNFSILLLIGIPLTAALFSAYTFYELIPSTFMPNTGMFTSEKKQKQTKYIQIYYVVMSIISFMLPLLFRPDPNNEKAVSDV